MPELLTLPKTARKTRPGGRLQIGTVGGFISEWWAASNRNARAECVGIYIQIRVVGTENSGAKEKDRNSIA